MNNESTFLARFTTGAHLGGIGLENFEPYLMNRIMGRYNASIRDNVIKLDLTTAKMRTLAVLSVVNGPVIRDLSVFAVVEQSTLSRSLNALEKDGMIRREADEKDTRHSYLSDRNRANGLRTILAQHGRGL